MKAIFVLVLVLHAAIASPQSATGSLVIRNARVITVSGAVIENGVVIVEGGTIKAVGINLTAPSGAQVIDAAGKVVMPGLLDANASVGIRGSPNEQSREITPRVNALALLNPQDKAFRRVLRGGVTTVCVAPGNLNIVGGLCAVVKTAGGATIRERCVKDAAALRAALSWDAARGNIPIRSGTPMTFYFRSPTQKFGVLSLLRKCFYDALRYSEDKPKTPNLDYETVLRALRGDLPLRITARSEPDILAALRVMDEFHIPRLILDEAHEGYRVADRLAQRKIPVILGPFFFYPTGPSQVEAGEISLANAAVLSDAGVLVALSANGADDTANLLTYAAFAVRHGMKPAAALRAVTLNPAKILGVDDRLGSIEPGKDADLLLLSGDPLDLTARVEKVIVGGKVVWEE